MRAGARGDPDGGRSGGRYSATHANVIATVLVVSATKGEAAHVPSEFEVA